ncbi:MAG: restriction endonuclease subunit S [Alphaproteobacteria bacterium]|nr:restriction endonuclease subunit S [Alphaproteobacteria bacterium]
MKQENLGGLINIQTGKLDANASSENGAYPFFTCAREPLRIDGWKYDLDAVLVAGNGNLNVKHYRGKFDAYQRTYILDINKPNYLDVRYLYHFMDSYLVTLRAQSIGGIIKYIKLGMLRNAKIPLPPLDKQKQIAEILDQADELRRLRQCTIDRLNTLGQAIFYEMFGDPTTNSKGWKTGTIRDLIREAKYGTSKKANTDGCGIPVLRMSNVTYQGELDLSDLKHVELSETELQKYTAQEDDILFNRTNSKELVGKTAVFNLPNLMVLAGYLVRARVNEQADPYYISAYMNSLHGKTTLQNMCKNIVGMANINAQEFQNIAIAIPPIEKQKSFRKKIEKIAKQKESLLNELTMYKNLFSSLQQRAFRGEL